MKGITGDRDWDDWVGGFYCLDGTHSEKAMYKKVGSAEDGSVLIYFHWLEEKWSLGEELGDIEYLHEDSSALTPPLGLAMEYKIWQPRSDSVCHTADAAGRRG